MLSIIIVSKIPLIFSFRYEIACSHTKPMILHGSETQLQTDVKQRDTFFSQFDLKVRDHILAKLLPATSFGLQVFRARSVNGVFFYVICLYILLALWHNGC
jgi:hypothetical protein